MSRKNVDKLMPPVMPTKEPLKRTMSQKNVDKLMPPVMPTKEPLKRTMSQKNVDKLIPPVIPTKKPLKRTMSQKNVDKLMPPVMPTKKLETDHESEKRRQANASCHAHKRALETDHESEKRRQADASCHAHKKALETDHETEKRRQANASCHAHKRALETPEHSEQRKIADRVTTANKRRRKRSDIVSLQHVIDSFIAKTKQGPDYVCTSCHRLMYKQNVVPVNVHKYSKATPALLADVVGTECLYTNVDGYQWICCTCNAALTRGNMPAQAIANGLRLSDVPPELSCLNALEIRLISLRVPFMKMVALPSVKQRCIHGPAVNVPSKLDSVCTVLPRLPSQSELIPLKLKRKLAYKGHYMYDYVTPEKVLNALRWLKLHNPLYANVEVNEEWVLDAEIDDHDLYASLTSSTDSDLDITNVESTEVAMDIDMNSKSSNCISNSEYTNDVSNSCPVTNVVSTEVAMNVDISYESDNISNSEPNIDSVDPASHANSDPNSMNDLETAKHNLETYATDNNFTIHNVQGDGNCLYNSVLYQLESNGVISTTVENLRQMVASYLEEHANLYMPFVVSPIASDNPYNNDTETPDAMDALISSMLCLILKPVPC